MSVVEGKRHPLYMDHKLHKFVLTGFSYDKYGIQLAYRKICQRSTSYVRIDPSISYIFRTDLQKKLEKMSGGGKAARLIKTSICS